MVIGRKVFRMPKTCMLCTNKPEAFIRESGWNLRIRYAWICEDCLKQMISSKVGLKEIGAETLA